MLSIETLFRKNRFVKSKNEVIVDLTRASLEYTSTVDITTFVMVSPDFVMRPDLIAKAVYGDPNKLDYLLKYNSVSNPFSIEVGDVLVVPDLDDMSKQFKTPNVDENDQAKKRDNQNTV